MTATFKFNGSSSKAPKDFLENLPLFPVCSWSNFSPVYVQHKQTNSSFSNIFLAWKFWVQPLSFMSSSFWLQFCRSSGFKQKYWTLNETPDSRKPKSNSIYKNRALFGHSGSADCNSRAVCCRSVLLHSEVFPATVSDSEFGVWSLCRRQQSLAQTAQTAGASIHGS